jgi:hypothetical protein
LKREAFARALDAIPIDKPIGGSMGPANQMGSVLAQGLAGSTIEGNRKMPAEVAIRADRPSLVAKDKGDDREPAVVVAKMD